MVKCKCEPIEEDSSIYTWMGTKYFTFGFSNNLILLSVVTKIVVLNIIDVENEEIRQQLKVQIKLQLGCCTGLHHVVLGHYF